MKGVKAFLGRGALLFGAVALLAIGAGSWFYSGIFLYPPRVSRSEGKVFWKYLHPREAGFNHEEVRLKSRDGRDLVGWFVENPACTDRAVIWVQHGRGVTAQKILEYFPFLYARDYHLFALELRNHGESGPGPTTYGATEVLDIAAGVDFLKGRLGEHSPRGALAFSMGAAIILLYQGVSPDFSAIVSDATYSNLKTQTFEYGQRLFKVGRYPLGELALGLAQWRAGVDLSKLDPLQAVPHIVQPILFIHGTDDEQIFPYHSERLYEKRGGPGELWLVPMARHVQCHQRQPQEYEQRVAKFFDRILRPPQ